MKTMRRITLKIRNNTVFMVIDIPVHIKTFPRELCIVVYL